MIQALTFENLDTKQLTPQGKSFMLKHANVLNIDCINRLNETLLTSAVSKMSDERRQFWVDIYAKSLIESQASDSASAKNKKADDHEKLIIAIAKHSHVKSTELVVNRLNTLRQQRAPFKGKYPKTSSTLYVIANILTVAMIWLLPKLWHGLMGTSAKETVKQPTLSKEERTRLEQMKTLRKDQDELKALLDSCPPSLVQGGVLDRAYCDEAKPMYEHLKGV